MSMSEWTLQKHAEFPGVPGPVVVCVMDGVGTGRQDDSDAVWLARTPTLDRLASSVPTGQLVAHGKAVGMPSDDDMGNSEVGHNAIGAGRIFDQGAKLVAKAISDGTLFEGEQAGVWQEATERVRERGSTMHFLGLLSDGNVHSHIDHLFALLRRCDREEIERVRVHVLLDGRDVPETSALDYVDALEELLETISGKPRRDYRIASGGGRMTTTMDRYEADWAMVERGWKTHVLGEGRGFESCRRAIEAFRDEKAGIGDQMLPQFVVVDGDGVPVGRMQDGDAVVFFNFRGDRSIEITQAFEDDAFPHFDRGPRPDLYYAGMMEYDGDLRLPSRYLVAPPAIDRTLGEYLARAGLPQLAISETQKFGHVTYFWNGNRSGAFDADVETYVEIPSDTRPFEERPWMKAAEITDRLIDELTTGRYRARARELRERRHGRAHGASRGGDPGRGGGRSADRAPAARDRSNGRCLARDRGSWQRGLHVRARQEDGRAVGRCRRSSEGEDEPHLEPGSASRVRAGCAPARSSRSTQARLGTRRPDSPIWRPVSSLCSAMRRPRTTSRR